MKKIIITLVVIGLAVSGYFLWKNFQGVIPAVVNPGEDITDKIPNSDSPNIPDAVNNTDFPLKLPKGFVISIFAKDLPGARVMTFDGLGNMWVSQTGKGSVSQIEIKDGKAVRVNEIFKNLDNPHGLAVDPAGGTTLYIAEETKISKVALYSEDTLHKIVDLPEGGRHFTRTLGFGPDGRLYVSIGSTCDVCVEKDERIATIYSMNKDGSDFKQVAGGLRNSVFFTWSEVDGRMWATEMGRDNLGDDLPPDEINIIPEGSGQAVEVSDFGWPICYGRNIHDSNFDKNQYIQDPCADKIPSFIDLPAHSAPLGLSFIPEEGWPEDMWYNLVVAMHGSWNRSEPTGYKIVRIKLNSKGEYLGMEDFISGWLVNGKSGSLGRPVDILSQVGGIMYISDDKAGVVYKVAYMPPVSDSSSQDFRNLNIIENQTINSPLKITGEAKGTWFFEASFPVKVVDSDWKELAAGIAQAGSDWMTEGFVPFSVTLNFTKPIGKNGWLVFKKDNPSGLPEHEAEYHLPIKF